MQRCVEDLAGVGKITNKKLEKIKRFYVEGLSLILQRGVYFYYIL